MILQLWDYLINVAFKKNKVIMNEQPQESSTNICLKEIGVYLSKFNLQNEETSSG